MHGRPLLAYSVEQAIASHCFQNVVVSTDSDELAEIALRFGAQVPFRRPPELATDSAPKLPAIQHALQESERSFGVAFDTVVDLDASAPLRTAGDITGVIELLENHDAPNVITGMPSRRSPYFNLIEQIDGVWQAAKRPPATVVRRQDAPLTVDMNASIYAWKASALRHASGVLVPGTAYFAMPEERSIDIDSEFDWKVVEFLLACEAKR